MSSDDEGMTLRRVSSVKKNKEKLFSEVPEDTKYKIEITVAGKCDKFKYKLKKGTPLPYVMNVTGLKLVKL